MVRSLANYIAKAFAGCKKKAASGAQGLGRVPINGIPKAARF